MPPITKNLLIINVLMYLAQLVGERYGVQLDSILGLHFILAEDFHVYQLVTYMFLHGSFMHLFFNMFSLWMFGRIMEQSWSAKRYLIFYFVCGVGAGVVQEIFQFCQYGIEGLAAYDGVNLGTHVIPMSEYLNMWTTIGASGACYGILLAFGMTYPNERIMLLIPPIPLKAKYFVIGYAVIELFSALGRTVEMWPTLPIWAVCFSVGCSSFIGGVMTAREVADSPVGKTISPDNRAGRTSRISVCGCRNGSTDGERTKIRVDLRTAVPITITTPAGKRMRNISTASSTR